MLLLLVPLVFTQQIVWAQQPAVQQQEAPHPQQGAALRGMDSPSADTAAKPARPVITTPDTTQSEQPSPVLLKPAIEKLAPQGPLTLSDAIKFAEKNYPSIKRSMAQMEAGRLNVTVQKYNEYLPDSLYQWQEIMASHNKLTQIIFGSPVFPANPGPGQEADTMRPYFYSGQGFSLDWAPLDFGLHKARIDLSKKQYGQASSAYDVTRLDVQIAAANAYFDVIEAVQEVRATEENVRSFDQFRTIVQAHVNAKLKPGADLALAEAQLANARNQNIRAQLNLETAKAGLSNALGVAGTDVDVLERGIATVMERRNLQSAEPFYDQVPILKAAQAALLTAKAQRRVLNKEYFPILHFLGGVQTRGSNQNVRGSPQSANFYGLVPPRPNYQVALIVNWNFLDWFRLRAEKKVQDQRIIAQQEEYNIVLQNLKTEDARSRARVRAAIAIAENMPVQVAAAETAAEQARTRYDVGLSSVAQVAEANQVLAQSRMQEAIAKVAVWRALLAVAAVHGDLRALMAEADRVQRSM